VTPSKFSEDQLVEQPAIALFGELGWSTVSAWSETLGAGGTVGREHHGEVVLTHRLRAALGRLNPSLPATALDSTVEQIVIDRSAMDPVRANRELSTLLRDGVRVKVRQDDGSETPEVVRVIDWRDPSANDFLLVSQMWIKSDLYSRRADLVGFVNGIPLVFVELKASHKNVRDAFDQNICDYRDTIPQIFVPNGFIICSNGTESKIGSVSSAWEHFADWKKISDETEAGVVSLETMIRGTCAKERLLDLVENFTVFIERPGGLVKLLAKNHQYLGVSNAIERLLELRAAPPEERGRLGVFWHTQGSGKTMSMLFFSQKVHRLLPGNWTFVMVTDRKDLDDQLYEEFSDAGVLTEGHVQATSSEHLRQLLREDHRYVFTLIQKFRTERGEKYPAVSDRSDVIVITDEAHRSQYDVLALNMRNALPNASFLGFTGTPLIVGEERTREVFGDYVSKYDFGASIQDGATVPLFYENRIPELQLDNDSFDEDLVRVLEEAELDDEQETKLARLFGKQYQLITRADRLDRIADDLVAHFLGRGFPGKAMVVSIDKATAVRMHDRVWQRWDERLARGRLNLLDAKLQGRERDLLEAEVAYMGATDMAVIVSQSQNEIATMKAKGLDILPHRQRMVTEDLESKFKDSTDPLRIVFVCAMWTTGFDVPSCSTIYLDKPMKNHTLMQTIARANRVFPDKQNGLIVDYIGVFRNLQAALAVYAAPGADGEPPVKNKDELIAWLTTAIENACTYVDSLGVDVDGLLESSGLPLLERSKVAVEQLIVTDEAKAQFLTHSRLVDQLFRAILPDPRANEFGPVRALVVFLAERIRALKAPVDVSHVAGRIEKLLDESVAANAYLIEAGDAEQSLINLNDVDWEALAQKFASGFKRTEAEKLRNSVAAKVEALARLNPSRSEWVERFQKLIEAYNAGSLNVEEFFKQLVAFTKGLNEEERRGLAEGLSEEQLAIYDLLMRPAPELSDGERLQVKSVAEQLLKVLKAEKLVLDWRKEQRARAAVRLAVETELDHLPEAFTTELFEEKCELVYRHVFDSYWDDGRSVYVAA
jgi:type I restriction enzyme R subunit